MGYVERSLGSGKPAIEIGGTPYDIDVFGMDDARSETPEEAFRFLFQLGYGYMIYLYVIQAGTRTVPGHFFHTFWTKDCAVYEVEMVEHGPPVSVKASAIALPLLYEKVTLQNKEGVSPVERTYVLAGQTFLADFSNTGPKELRMCFQLRDEETPLRETRLLWSLPSGWTFEEADSLPRALGPLEWFFFSNPR